MQRTSMRQRTSVMMSAVKIPPKLGAYTVDKQKPFLGKGAFGKVYKCFDTISLRIVAVKTVPTNNLDAKQKKNVESEVELMASLPPHPNIVQYIEAFTDNNTSLFCIVLEYVEQGSLQSFIHKLKRQKQQISEQNVSQYIKQILCGLDFLHNQGIIHRDIKAANVLITSSMIVKLTDFGIANKCDDNIDLEHADFAGSAYWMSPEVIQMQGKLTPACDIWAVGATAIELYTGKPPYSHLQPLAALFRIVSDANPRIPPKTSALFQEFLFNCFNKDASRRPSAKELLASKWFIIHEYKHAAQRSTFVDYDSAMLVLKDSHHDLDAIKEEKLTEKEDEEEETETESSSDSSSSSDDDDDDDGSSSYSCIEIDLDALDKEYNENKAETDSDVDDWDDYDETLTMGANELKIQKARNNAANQLDSIHQILKKLDRIITYLQHYDALDPKRESQMIYELSNLNEIFSGQPSLISQCIKTAVIPMIETLNVPSDSVKECALKTIEIIIADNINHLETLCLVQLIPQIGKLIGENSNIKIRDLTAALLKKFVDKNSNKIVQKMFIACGGIGILVDCLRNKYISSNKKIILIGIQCIHTILESRIHNRRDLGRLFTKHKLLNVLLKRCHEIIRDSNKEDIITKMCSIIFRMAQLTDSVIRTSISGILTLQNDNEFGIFSLNKNKNKNKLVNSSSLGLLPSLLHLLPSLKQDNNLEFILRSINELSKDSNCIVPLTEALALTVIMPFLASSNVNIQTHVINILWNMTRINNIYSARARAEVAVHGSIPILKSIYKNDKHKAMFFLTESICKFPNDALKQTLFEMKKHNLSQFYIDITKSDHCLRFDGLSAIARWIENDDYVPHLEFVISRNDNITQLITIFKPHKKQDINATLVHSFKIIIEKSKKISIKLAKSDIFLNSLNQWFRNDNIKQKITNDLLKMLIELFHHLEPKNTVKTANIVLPMIDKEYLKAKKRKKIIGIHLIEKMLIPTIAKGCNVNQITAQIQPRLKQALYA